MFRPFALGILGAFALAAHAEPALLPAAKISTEDFGALPFLSQPKISPSGQKVMARAFLNGAPQIAIIDFSPAKASSRFPVPDKRDLLWYRWAGEDKVLVAIGRSDHFEGEDTYITRLVMVNLKDNSVNLIGKKDEGPIGDDAIYVDPEGHFLLLNFQTSVYDYPSVWRVDLDTLKMKRVVESEMHVWDWYADSNGTVRAGVGRDGRRWWLLYRNNADEKFTQVIKKKVDTDKENGDVERFILLGDSPMGYAVANTKTGRYGIYRYDFTTDTLGEAIFEHPTVDVDDFYQDSKGEITAVFYTDDRSRVEWLNPKMKALQSDIDQALPNRINRVVSLDRDAGKMIVWTGGDSDPGRYYFYQVSAGKMQLLAQPYNHMSGKTLANMKSVSYHARDGLEIPAYLTVPVGRDPKSLPLIVMPHGGPFVRDEWGYDGWAQFLANRGYLVLQPNYRGSTGYGKAFVAKGMGEWGRAMQDDIDDGVKWLAESGEADPKRVCIMGASYGGYAAMWAAARNPDIYRCAISFAGISDVEAILRYDRRSFSAPRYYRNWREKVQGAKDFDLGTVSPIKTVDRVGIPLLIAHGDKDDTVPMSQSKKFHEALTKANKPHEYVIYPGEAHGFDQPEHAIDFLNRVDAFLLKYNPADPQ